MAIAAVAKTAPRAVALGPGYAVPWPLPGGRPPVEWLQSPPGIQAWMVRYTWLRWRSGLVNLIQDRRLGQWAATEIQRRRPERVYAFTQIALESLRWAARHGVPTVLDNPNGHIRNFQQVCERESQRWCGRAFHGHPVAAMVHRIEEEYRLANAIRVYSEWAKASLVHFGVPAAKIHVVRPTLDLERFHPVEGSLQPTGPLRVCYVGTLDLRKGFVYLLRAIRAIGAQHVVLRIAGSTGDRECARLFRKESAGLQIEVTPGDPVPTYHQAEILVVPTLEDAFSFVVAEGMACGLPVIVTSEAGAAECVRPGRSGWIVPAAEVDALAAAIDTAMRQRAELPEMGRLARVDVAQCAGPAQVERLAQWFDEASRISARA